jgi:predicted alpha/beta hydrolase family esterase
MNTNIAKLICCILTISSYTFSSDKFSNQKSTTTVTCHGLGGSNYNLINKFLHHKIIKAPIIGVKFNDFEKCLGQKHDITKIKVKTSKIELTHNIFLACHSRGGSAALNYLAQENPENVQGILIDGSPADMVDRTQEILYLTGLHFLCPTRAGQEFFLRIMYPGYPKNSTPPYKAITHIKNKSLAAFIVHSKNDTLINFRAGLKNYKAFRQAGFDHAYFLGLEHGGHNHNSDGKDSHIYQTAINSFYKKHGLPYHEEHATLSDQELAALQPSIEEVDEQIKIEEIKLNEKYLAQRTINLSLAINAAFLYAAYKQSK